MQPALRISQSQSVAGDSAPGLPTAQRFSHLHRSTAFTAVPGEIGKFPGTRRLCSSRLCFWAAERWSPLPSCALLQTPVLHRGLFSPWEVLGPQGKEKTDEDLCGAFKYWPLTSNTTRGRGLGWEVPAATRKGWGLARAADCLQKQVETPRVILHALLRLVVRGARLLWLQASSTN